MADRKKAAAKAVAQKKAQLEKENEAAMKRMQMLAAKKVAEEVAIIAWSCVPPVLKMAEEAQVAVKAAKAELIAQQRRDKMERQRKLFLEDARLVRVQKVEELAVACRFYQAKRYMEQCIFEELGIAGLHKKVEDPRMYTDRVAQSMQRKMLMARHEPLWDIVPVVSAVMTDYRSALDRIPEGPRKAKLVERILAKLDNFSTGDILASWR